MSVLTQIERIEANIDAAYVAAADKNATLPINKNSENLAATIRTIIGTSTLPRAEDYEF
jgi:hypothetical protein